MAKVTLAQSISAHVCEHGAITLRLHNEDGVVFAAIQLDPDSTGSLISDMLEQIEVWRADSIGKCEGSA